MGIETDSKMRSTQKSEVDKSPATSVPPIVRDAIQSPGQPLAPEARAYMEPRFGHDFGKVRVHTDTRAADSARAMNALAYTLGQDIVLGSERYFPRTVAGKQLLAHELTHVVQQAQGGESGQSEQRADAAAASVVLGEAVSPAQLGGASQSVQMKPDDPASKPAEDKPAAD